VDPQDEELAGVENLAPDDPQVAGRGPRVRARLRAYRAFVAPGEAPEGARVGEAEDRLGEILEREIGAPVAGTSMVGTTPATANPARDGFWTWLLGPRMRPALALGALLVVVGGVWLTRSGFRAEQPVLRGSNPPATATELATVTVTRGDGSVRLEWLAAPGAASYTLVFLSPELNEIARLPDVHGTSFDLRPGALPAGLAPGASALWRVEAMSGNDELARSKVTSITIP
jgi:hypothetical protein